MSSTYERAYDAVEAHVEHAQTAIEGGKKEIADLRKRIEDLMAERVSPAIADVVDQAGAAGKEVSKKMRHQADRVGAKVRDEPLIAICVAAAAGFLVARILRR